LSQSYTGPLINLTRASDSATQDIYPNAAGDLDQNAVTTFCRATTCAVNRVYDQSGNSVVCTQATTASQPALVLRDGNLNNRASMTFGDGTAIALSCAAQAPINDIWQSSGYMSMVAFATGGSSGADRMWSKSNLGTVGVELRGATNSYAPTLAAFNSSTTGTWISPAALVAQAEVIDVKFNSTSTANVPTIGVNGVAQTLTATQPGATPTTDAGQNLIIGNSVATGGTRGFAGSIPEVVFWKSATPDAPTIEALRRNQAAYYGVAGVQ
jgi:hypothetical protein